MEKKLWKEIFQYGLAAVIVLGIFAIVIVLVNSKLDPSVHDAMMILLGVLASGFTGVAGYFFGSSKGSAEKNEMIKNGAPKP